MGVGLARAIGGLCRDFCSPKSSTNPLPPLCLSELSTNSTQALSVEAIGEFDPVFRLSGADESIVASSFVEVVGESDLVFRLPCRRRIRLRLSSAEVIDESGLGFFLSERRQIRSRFSAIEAVARSRRTKKEFSALQFPKTPL